MLIRSSAPRVRAAGFEGKYRKRKIYIMSFTSVMTFLCVSYIFVYAGMIAYDLFFTKEAVDLTPKVEEQEIDISDEAKTFHPVMIEKEGKEKSLVASIASELSRMTGGIEMDDLVPMLNELAEKGKDSPLGGLVNDWNEYEQAA
jgi:hypothetical protein